MVEIAHGAEALDVLILAPTGQDASLIADVLSRENVRSRIMRDAAALIARLKAEDAGALLVAEEALNSESVSALNECFRAQAAWSDIPIIVMTSGGASTFSSAKVLQSFTPSGNVTLLERPLRQITLVSSLQVALRARKRQYQVRELLELQIQATRIRDEFISIASHELKTPLTSLKLQTQLSERMMALGNPAAFAPDRVKKLIESTHSQVDRLARLVEDMLDISRISTGKLTMEKSLSDLAALAREVAERFLPQFNAVQSTVHIQADQPVTATLDRYRMEQVISNLLTNAIRYSPGTPVWIEVKSQKGMGRLTVRDEGPGISLENQERVFKRFERAVSASSISGLGLGLYICKEILDSHQGTIRVESEPGKGAAFIVEVPLHNTLIDVTA